MKIIAVTICIFTILLSFSLCRTAKMSDKKMREMFGEEEKQY